jgi:hypothetical protein
VSDILEMTDMFQVSNRKRIPYARALYLAAVAALIAGCSQPDAPLIESASATSNTALSTDVPEVVITASRVTTAAKS